MSSTFSLIDKRQRLAAACLAACLPAGLAAVGIVPALTAMSGYFEARGFSPLFAQMIVACPAAVMVVASPLYGLIIPVFGQRTFLVVCLVLYVTGGTAGAYLAEPVLFIVSRLILGLGVAGLLVAVLSIVGDSFSGSARDKLLGAVSAIGGVSSICGLILGGVIVDSFGWRGVFYFYFIGLIIIPIVWIGIPNERACAVRKKEGRDKGSPLWSVAPLYVLVGILVLGQFMQFSQLPFLLDGKGISSATTQGFIISGTAATASLGAAFYGWTRRVLSENAIVVAITIIFGVCIVATEYSSDIWLVSVICAVMGFAMGNIEPVSASIILRKIMPCWRAKAMGFLISALYLGQFLNPILFDPFRRAFGLNVAFRGAGYVFLLLALFGFLCSKIFALAHSGRNNSHLSTPCRDEA